MKIMFISDIHGVKTNLAKVKEKFEELQCDKLVMLGDLYYIGPKGKIQEDYDIPYIQEFLKSFKDKLICIKGNCDSEVDVMISDFTIVNELSLLLIDNKEIYLTHGHIYNEDNWDKENSILIYGHFHKPFIKEKGSNIFINPGSISLPKENAATYLIYDAGKFTIYDINDNIITSLDMN